jgi:hypothetical protein
MTGVLIAMNAQLREHARQMPYPGYLQIFHTCLKMLVKSKREMGMMEKAK